MAQRAPVAASRDELGHPQQGVCESPQSPVSGGRERPDAEEDLVAVAMDDECLLPAHRVSRQCGIGEADPVGFTDDAANLDRFTNPDGTDARGDLQPLTGHDIANVSDPEPTAGLHAPAEHLASGKLPHFCPVTEESRALGGPERVALPRLPDGGTGVGGWCESEPVEQMPVAKPDESTKVGHEHDAFGEHTEDR